MIGVHRMLEDKLERHKQIWSQFTKTQEAAKKELEQAVAQCAAGEGDTHTHTHIHTNTLSLSHSLSLSLSLYLHGVL